ncbi:hypothetical protein ACFLZD_02505, partial [Candidatus Neomarinimicrobiota bacterium]
MKNFIEYFIKHRVIANWIMLVICLAGVFALFNLQTRINPKAEQPYSYHNYHRLQQSLLHN